MDDDFNTTTLVPKWTVTQGSSGTVDLLATSVSTGVYDLTTNSGYLSCQTDDGGKVFLRQDYPLPDGKSVVMKLHPSVNGSSNLASELIVGLVLNTADGSPLTATTSGYMCIQFETITDGWRLYAARSDTSGAIVDSTAIAGGGGAGNETPINGNTVYLRIARSGSTYSWFCSFDGIAWLPMKGKQTPPSTFTNIWIRSRCDADTGSKILPVQLIDWIKEVDNTTWVV